MMKILLINNAELTISFNDLYVENSTGLFAKELQTLGHDINFYGQKLKSTGNTVHNFGIRTNGMKVSGLKRKRNKILNYLCLYVRIIPEVFKSDFIYIFYPTSFKYVSFICKLLNKRYGLYVRGLDDFKGKLAHYIYKNSFCVLTVSDYFTDYINNISNTKKAETIRPMIPYSEKDIIFDRVYLIDDVLNILYIGRMTNDKGIIELLYAIKKIKDEKELKIRLKLVGNGEYIEELKLLTKNLLLTEDVSFEGAVFELDKIKNYYLKADLFILPSYHEGFPRSLYEAMIFGTPVITSFVGGISSLMKNRYNCIEIQPKSIDSVIESILFFVGNYHQVKVYAKNATNTVSLILNERKYTHAQALNNRLKQTFKNEY